LRASTARGYPNGGRLESEVARKLEVIGAGAAVSLMRSITKWRELVGVNLSGGGCGGGMADFIFSKVTGRPKPAD